MRGARHAWLSSRELGWDNGGAEQGQLWYAYGQVVTHTDEHRRDHAAVRGHSEAVARGSTIAQRSGATHTGESCRHKIYIGKREDGGWIPSIEGM